MTAQERFNAAYITSSEICRRLGVTRGALVQARSKGKLPEAISVENHMMIWEREVAEPFVQAWDKSRRERAGVA